MLTDCAYTDNTVHPVTPFPDSPLARHYRRQLTGWTKSVLPLALGTVDERLLRIRLNQLRIVRCKQVVRNTGASKLARSSFTLFGSFSVEVSETRLDSGKAYRDWLPENGDEVEPRNPKTVGSLSVVPLLKFAERMRGILLSTAFARPANILDRSQRRHIAQELGTADA
ncbi:hypothetical protein NliqN6_5630 [Naganishia liquefaciens]|uniref:Uncharacterized protein n=1 Tax=Naganishia liquefaciens TaxID=104408 RepID=A0A8H3YHC7_9TREE|nr:hypothetical protein NliqN6_5630 [Naganishia liquefaciens]